MATEPDPKEMLGALMNITQVQQRQTADLLEDMRREIGKLQTATALAQGAAGGIETSAASTVQAVARLEAKVSQAAAAAVTPAMEAAFKWAVVPAVKAIDVAAEPILAKLSGAAEKAGSAVDQAELKMRQAAQWVTWKVGALVALTVLAIWALAWYGVWSARQEAEALRAEIETMKATVAELEKKGGQLTLNRCGGEICIQVDRNQRTDAPWAVPWGDAKKGYFVIPKLR